MCYEVGGVLMEGRRVVVWGLICVMKEEVECVEGNGMVGGGLNRRNEEGRKGEV